MNPSRTGDQGNIDAIVDQHPTLCPGQRDTTGDQFHQGSIRSRLSNLNQVHTRRHRRRELFLERNATTSGGSQTRRIRHQ